MSNIQPVARNYDILPHPSIGRIVRYVTDEGKLRAAIIVRVWDKDYVNQHHPGMSNLQVFLDGENDELRGSHRDLDRGGPQNTKWMGSVAHSFDMMPGTWHWPPRE